MKPAAGQDAWNTIGLFYPQKAEKDETGKSIVHNLTQGNSSFPLRGIVTCTQNISTVKAVVTNTATGTAPTYASRSGINAKWFDLWELDENLKFSALAAGKYNLTITGTTDSGSTVTLLDTTDTEAVRAAVRPNTKLIHVETPGNPTTGISDIDAIADIAHKAGALLSVDATFAGPICIRPLSHGADLEIHSMTKYINGHGDSLGGCVLGRTALIDQIKELAMVNYGGILSPFNAWLVARGLSTVPLRMKQHSAVAMKVAEFLESCPATRFVWYPGLKIHPQHERAEKLMHGEYSGMISFDLKGDEKQHEKFLDALKLVTHAVSLGDIETLIVYYDRNSDKLPHYPAVYQEGFFRFSIGLEDAEDIIADLTQAMQAAGML